MAALPSNLQIVYIYFFVISLMFVSFMIRWNFVSVSHPDAMDRENDYAIWEDPFPSPMYSNMTDLSCYHDEKPICCALLDSTKNPNIYPRKREDITEPHLRTSNRKPLVNSANKCEIVREYIPSPYEQVHLTKAQEIGELITEEARREALTDFVFEDLKHVPFWLARIRVHMEAPHADRPTDTIHHDTDAQQHAIHITEEDLEYLSRFKLTRICDNDASRAYTWYEWIEPITVYTRHPYSLLLCMNITKTITYHSPYEVHYKNQSHWMESHSVGLINPDYVLLQSRTSYQESIRYHPNRKHHVPKRYFFDVGSSTFDSSLFWFLCAYLQKGFDFDQIYAWEARFLEPNDFWRRVPARIMPFLHYFNLPMASPEEESSSHDVFSMIEQIATEDDFVSVKLDVDNHLVEIPLAVSLLQLPNRLQLIDEFFFELHYRCEFLMYCGWGSNIPFEMNDLVLDRYHAMKFFQSLRQAGLRAHIWP